MNAGADEEERRSVPQVKLTVHDGIAITGGTVFGAGVFRAPFVVAQGSPSATGMLLL